MMRKTIWDKVTQINLVVVLLVEHCHLLQKVPPVYCHRTGPCPSGQRSSFHPPLHTARVASTQVYVCSRKDFPRIVGLIGINFSLLAKDKGLAQTTEFLGSYCHYKI